MTNLAHAKQYCPKYMQETSATSAGRILDLSRPDNTSSIFAARIWFGERRTRRYFGLLDGYSKELIQLLGALLLSLLLVLPAPAQPSDMARRGNIRVWGFGDGLGLTTDTTARAAQISPGFYNEKVLQRQKDFPNAPMRCHLCCRFNLGPFETRRARRCMQQLQCSKHAVYL